MAREFSAGGVVLRRMQGRWFVAAIRPRRERAASARGRKPELKEVLALPKGIVDPGERPECTAQREVREETGIEARLLTKLGDVKYVYLRSWGDRQRVFKVVSFYLFVYSGGRLGDIAPEMQHEVESAEWVALEEAAARLSYPGERAQIAAAQEYLRDHPELGS